MSKSVLENLVDVSIEDNEFTPEGGGDLVKYRRLQVKFYVGGEEQTVLFQPTQAEGKSAFGLLLAAQNPDEV